MVCNCCEKNWRSAHTIMHQWMLHSACIFDDYNLQSFFDEGNPQLGVLTIRCYHNHFVRNWFPSSVLPLSPATHSIFNHRRRNAKLMDQIHFHFLWVHTFQRYHNCHQDCTEVHRVPGHLVQVLSGRGEKVSGQDSSESSDIMVGHVSTWDTPRRNPSINEVISLMPSSFFANQQRHWKRFANPAASSECPWVGNIQVLQCAGP